MKTPLSALLIPVLAPLLVGALAGPADAQCSPPASWPAGQAFMGVGFKYADISIWSGTSEELDCYLPTGWNGSQALPTVLFIHGGGSRAGDKGQPALFFKKLLEFGYPVVSTNYQLAPTECVTGAFPEATRDVRAAVDWIHRAPGMDPAGQDVCLPTCVVAVGSSTGAYHAAMLGVLDGAADGGLFDPGIAGGEYGVDLAIMISGAASFYTMGADGDCPESACQLPPLDVSFPAPGICFPGLLRTPFVEINDPAAPFNFNDWSGFPPGFPALTTEDWEALPWGDDLPNGCWPPELLLGCEWGSGACPQATPPALPSNGLTGNCFADASPLNWVDAGDADFHVFHGICDFRAPYHTVELLQAELEAAGMGVVVEAQLTSNHGMSTSAQALLSINQGATEVDDAISDWMAAGGCSGGSTAGPVRLRTGGARLLLRSGLPTPGSRIVLGVEPPPGLRPRLALVRVALQGSSGTLLRTPFHHEGFAELEALVPRDPSVLAGELELRALVLGERDGVPAQAWSPPLRLRVRN